MELTPGNSSESCFNGWAMVPRPKWRGYYPGAGSMPGVCFRFKCMWCSMAKLVRLQLFHPYGAWESSAQKGIVLMCARPEAYPKTAKAVQDTYVLLAYPRLKSWVDGFEYMDSSRFSRTSPPQPEARKNTCPVGAPYRINSG